MKSFSRAHLLTVASALALAVSLAPTAAMLQAPSGNRGPFGLDGADLSPKAPVKHNTPAEEQKLFQLKPGYSMTPVLTDPQIQQPGAISFDANGRMYVLELRGYMLDVEAKDELSPNGRISRWEDKDGDGVYETGTVFVDNLVFPRFATPLGDGQLIVKESNSDDTWLYTDTNGDGKADKRELFTTGLGRSGNVEHQESHLTWGMDNWMYSTYNSVRVRWTPNGIQKEATGTNGAAWGVTQDNYGKMWFQNGASGIPSYFQFPIVYGTINNPDAYQDGYRVPWGAPIGVGDMQGGQNAVRQPDGTANGTSAGAGANIYRGDRLPKELVGDYFYGEVVARILRRSHPVDMEGLTQVQNVYQNDKSEFIRSMDPLFRPVDNKTAPDGTLYVVDMYHGIIQEGEWTPAKSYLRAKIQQYGLDKAVSMGRIWRLSYQGMPRDTTKPHMYQDTSAQLVKYLDHPNGWWRDTAQQQLVLRQDKSVVPALKTMAMSDKNQLGRIHAMWTLEGLSSLDSAQVHTLMKDPDPKIRAEAIRVSESLYKGGDKSFEPDYKTLTTDKDVDVAIQALLTINYLKIPNALDTAKSLKAANPAKGMQLVSNFIITPPAAGGGGGGGDNPPVLTAAERVRLDKGGQTFREVCGECHGADGLGAPDGQGGKMAPALAGNHRVQGSPEHIMRVLLHGLQGPLDGKTYTAGLMVPINTETDEAIASVASYVRNQLTNNGTMITPDMVAKMRTEDAKRSEPYTDTELAKLESKVMTPGADWKVTASQSAAVVVGGTARASDALGLQGWTTGVAQTPGMFWQVELPKATNLSGLDFQALTVRQAFSAAMLAAPAAQPAQAPGAPAPPTVARAPQPPRQVAYPRGYKIEVSTDGQTWKTVSEGKGESMYNNVLFAPTQAKFLRITQTASGADLPMWGMRYLRLYEKV